MANRCYFQRASQGGFNYLLGPVTSLPATVGMNSDSDCSRFSPGLRRVATEALVEFCDLWDALQRPKADVVRLWQNRFAGGGER